MRYLFAALFAALSTAIASAAYAACDISQFKDEMSYHKDILTNLAYINQVSSREDRSKNDNADIVVGDYGSFNYGQASALSSSLQTMLDIKGRNMTKSGSWYLA